MKRGALVICVFLVLLLSVNLVSAGWLDKITGKVIDASCTDSDGGQNFFVFGKTYGSDKYGEYFEVKDFCEGNVIIEYYCENNELKSIDATCDYGCENGACLQKEEAYCIDTDNDKDYYVKGYAYDSTGKNLTDYCQGPSTLIEAICRNDNAQYTTYTCPNRCIERACIEEGVEINCTDSDGGFIVGIKGKIDGYSSNGFRTIGWDTCFSETSVKEWYCEEGKYTKQRIYDCMQDSKVCSDGACVKSAEKPNCTDSDGGFVPNIKGTIDGYSDTGFKITNRQDECSSESSLKEYYCNEQGYVKQRIYDCSSEGKVCKEGICVEGSANNITLCSDNIEVGYLSISTHYTNKNKDIIITTKSMFDIPYFTVKLYNNQNQEIKSVNLYDDGNHNDNLADDYLFGNVLNTGDISYGEYILKIFAIENNQECLISNMQEKFNLIDINCLPLIQDHNNLNENRINLVFVGEGYNNSEYIQLVRDTIDYDSSYHGIFGIEPFKSNKDKFNIWYIDYVPKFDVPRNPIKNITDKIVDFGSSAYSICNYPNTFPILWTESWAVGYAELNGIAYCGVSTERDDWNSPRRIECAIHELGHSFGLLLDEYSMEERDYEGYIESINCFAAESEEECLNNAPWKDLIGRGCGEEYKIDCLPENPEFTNEIRCWEGCNHATSGAYRSTYSSIMGYQKTGGLNLSYMVDFFNPFPSFKLVNERLLCKRILNLTGGIGGYCTEKFGLSGEIMPAQAKTQAIQTTQLQSCSGCLVNNECIAYGIRKDNQYCSLDKEMKNQKSNQEICKNNFECKSNLCVNDKCISKGLLIRITNWLKRLFR